MALVARSEFRRRLRRLDEQEFGAFVAALWRARGAEVRREGTTLEARHRGRRERIHLDWRPWWGRWAGGTAPTNADVVVRNTAGGDPDVPSRVVDADDLYDLAAYAIDRGRGDELCRSYLGHPLTGSAADSPPMDRRRVLLVVAGAALAGLLLVGSLGAPGWGSDEVDTTPAPTTTFGPPVEDLAYSRMWPEDERAPAGPGPESFEPRVEELPFTEMRPNHDDHTATRTRDRPRGLYRVHTGTETSFPTYGSVESADFRRV